MQSDSVQRWLDDLRHMTEVECMCVLQAKPLGVDEEELMVRPGYTCSNVQLKPLLVTNRYGIYIKFPTIPSVQVTSQGAWPARSNLQTLLRRALVVSTELGRMFSRVEKGRWQRTHSTAIRTHCHLRALLQHYSTGRSIPTEITQVREGSEPCVTLFRRLVSM